MKPWSALREPARVWRLFVQTFGAWSSDKVPRHGAALAYYTVLSLVPLLVVIIGMIGLIFGQEAAQGYIAPTSKKQERPARRHRIILLKDQGMTRTQTTCGQLT